MVKTALIRRAVSFSTAAMMTCFGLTGVVSAQTISNTGPGSTNTITSTNSINCTITNNNNLSTTNTNDQSATTGNSSSDGNTVAGLPWTGWNALDPAAAQAAGQSYASWQANVLNWVSQRANGAGWNSNNTDLSWTPSGSSWTSFDPMVWQSAGQSFGNWYNSVASYLNGNSATWILSWPSTATGGDSLGGTSTGDATNTNNVSFSISINNAARDAAGTNSCGQSNFTPPTGNGMGAGPGIGSTPTAFVGSTGAGYSPHYSNGSGLGGGSRYYSYRPATTSYRAPSTPAVSAPAPAKVSVAPVAPAQPVVVAPVEPAQPINSISNTGPGSHNTISTTTSSNYQVTNNNNVSASSNNTQAANSGSATTNGNTVAGGNGTGDASNGNSSGTGVGVSN